MGTSGSKKKNKDSTIVKKPQVLTKSQKDVILKQQSKSLCQISTKEGKASGFLCKIPYPVLITSNHILNESQIKPGKEIYIDFVDEDKKISHKTIKIGNERTTYSIEKLNEDEIDVTIIELKLGEDNLDKQEFIEIDKDLMNERVEKLYEGKDVYIIYYEKDERKMSATGIINKIEKKNNTFTLIHTCDAKHDTSGSPILSYDHKVIGLNQKNVPNGQFNRATLLQFPIKEFLTKLEQKKVFSAKENIEEKDQKNTSEDDKSKNKKEKKISGGVTKITLTYNFFDDKIKVFGKEFVEKNKGNLRLLINKKTYNLSEYLPNDIFSINEDDEDDEDDDSLSIELEEIKTGNLTDLSFMFSDCDVLTSVNFQSFNMQNVTNMSSMFSNCIFLTSINLSSFNTQNVTDMSSMFSACPLLTSLNLSSFNTEKVTNMSNMFFMCSELKTVDLRSFKTENVTNMGSMFFECPSLASLDLRSFNTQNVTDMQNMFYNCKSLTSLNLSSFNADNANTIAMFVGCKKLKNCGSSDVKISSEFRKK